MTTADLRALLDAAAAATPGPVRNSQCGLEECAGKRECTLCVAQRTYDPAKALAAAASPDTICKLCQIALAAIVRHKADEALQIAEDDVDALPDAYFSALEDHNKAWTAEAEALHDAGLI